MLKKLLSNQNSKNHNGFQNTREVNQYGGPISANAAFLGFPSVSCCLSI